MAAVVGLELRTRHGNGAVAINRIGVPQPGVRFVPEIPEQPLLSHGLGELARDEPPYTAAAGVVDAVLRRFPLVDRTTEPPFHALDPGRGVLVTILHGWCRHLAIERVS